MAGRQRSNPRGLTVDKAGQQRSNAGGLTVDMAGREKYWQFVRPTTNVDSPKQGGKSPEANLGEKGTTEDEFSRLMNMTLNPERHGEYRAATRKWAENFRDTTYIEDCTPAPLSSKTIHYTYSPHPIHPHNPFPTHPFPSFKSRWGQVLSAYNRIKTILQTSQDMEDKNTLSLYLNETTISSWYRNKTRNQEVSMLLQGLKVPVSPRPVPTTTTNLPPGPTSSTTLPTTPTVSYMTIAATRTLTACLTYPSVPGVVPSDWRPVGETCTHENRIPASLVEFFSNVQVHLTCYKLYPYLYDPISPVLDAERLQTLRPCTILHLLETYGVFTDASSTHEMVSLTDTVVITATRHHRAT
ncbi:hypothetical protein Bbelb_035230 [Branchiostoma belcheri]|nr:hypothetical protein Bbelb_035230 [Branchiostoma belcheri]